MQVAQVMSDGKSCISCPQSLGPDLCVMWRHHSLIGSVLGLLMPCIRGFTDVLCCTRVAWRSSGLRRHIALFQPWRLFDATVTLKYTVLRLHLHPLRYNATTLTGIKE